MGSSATHRVAGKAPAASRAGWAKAARITKIAALALLLAAGAASLANAVTAAVLARRYAPLGKIYQVEGYGMHLYCTGQGSPTIVMEAGSGDDLLYWQTIQPALARVTRVCSYDRAGLGWSEPRPGEHDAVAIARELHALLAAAGVPRPMAMVGASAGGFYVREYAREYPGEIAGVALLDASSPHQLDELPGSRAWFEAERARRRRLSPWQKLRVALGWERLMGRCHDQVPPALAAWRGNSDAEQCRLRYVDGELPEWSEFDVAAQQAARLTTFGDLPLLVMSQDPDRPKPGWSPDAIAAQPVWWREQEALKSLSPRSWRVVARGSGHHIHQERPELVIAEITALVNYVRGGSAPPLGTTTIQ